MSNNNVFSCSLSCPLTTSLSGVLLSVVSCVSLTSSFLRVNIFLAFYFQIRFSRQVFGFSSGLDLFHCTYSKYNFEVLVHYLSISSFATLYFYSTTIQRKLCVPLLHYIYLISFSYLNSALLLL